LGGDLSSYRGFQLGASVAAVAKRADMSPPEVQALHLRPAPIQELTWRPRTMESAQEVVFRFYEGELFRIEVRYDETETEGLTNGDMVAALAVVYGVATLIPAPPTAALGSSEDDKDVRIAEWQDARSRFELVRPAHESNFRLIGVLKRLEAPVQAALLEAQRLDEVEAPQREATRIAREEAAVSAKLEQTRLANKAKFRP
jgi:hypothetical protein